MQTVQAEFVDMIMERMHRMEESNILLQKENAQLRAIVKKHDDALLMTLHVVPSCGFTDFSDDWSMIWPLGETPTMQDNKEREECCYDVGLPLDKDHEEATMFFGERVVEFSTDLGHGLSVGSAYGLGQHGAKTTFGQFWRLINSVVNSRECLKCFKGKQYLGLEWKDPDYTTLRVKADMCEISYD